MFALLVAPKSPCPVLLDARRLLLTLHLYAMFRSVYAANDWMAFSMLQAAAGLTVCQASLTTCICIPSIPLMPQNCSTVSCHCLHALLRFIDFNCFNPFTLHCCPQSCNMNDEQCIAERCGAHVKSRDRCDDWCVMMR